MVHYKPVKVMIDVQSLAAVIINIVVHFYNILKSIITN